MMSCHISAQQLLHVSRCFKHLGLSAGLCPASSSVAPNVGYNILSSNVSVTVITFHDVSWKCGRVAAD